MLVSYRIISLALYCEDFSGPSIVHYEGPFHLLVP